MFYQKFGQRFAQEDYRLKIINYEMGTANAYFIAIDSTLIAYNIIGYPWFGDCALFHGEILQLFISAISIYFSQTAKVNLLLA